VSRAVLIVEDDESTSSFIAKGLHEAGFTTEIAGNGHDALRLAMKKSYDIIVLDRMLPGLDGLTVLRALRSENKTTPVILLSALSSLDERVRGLREGSDDYLVKPFGFSELLARIEVLLRRGTEINVPVKLECGDLEMDLVTRTVTRSGNKIDLLPREFQLLEFLLRHKGQLVTRTMLLEGLWNRHFDPGTNVIDVHVSRLRHKVDKDYEHSYIRTVRGTGYMVTDK
jgi:two-component system OmpR family response regulator